MTFGNKAHAGFETSITRGDHTTRFRGLMGAVSRSALAMGLAAIGGLMGASSALAQSCTLSGSTYTCSGSTTTNTSLGGVPITVNLDSTFVNPVAGINGDAVGVNGYGSLTLNQAAGSSVISNSSGGGSGIFIYDYYAPIPPITSTDMTNITVAGSVQAQAAGGIGVWLNATTTPTVNFTQAATSTITGGQMGVFLRGGYGTGPMTVNLAGVIANTTVTAGSYGYGLQAGNQGTDLTINQASTSTITGTAMGISAFDQGTGALKITTAGTVTGGSASGIAAYGLSGITGVTVTQNAGSITGGTGIATQNFGTGATAITTAGTVTATDVNGAGISAYNGATATDLAVTQNGGTIAGTGGANGVAVQNYGTGLLSVNQNAGSISGFWGIWTASVGTGATSISTAGSVTGTAGYGASIYAQNLGANSTDLTINQTAGSISDTNAGGIYARNLGTGVTNITTAGAVTGTGAGYSGILAYTAGNTTGLAVTQTAGTITGSAQGVYSENYGKGANSVTQDGGAITATVGDGVAAVNSTGAGALSVTQASGGTILGGTNGINAQNNGTGDTTIATAGSVTGTSSYGVEAYNASTAGALNVTQTAGSISGGLQGVYATNWGSGATAIAQSAGASITGGDAIAVQNFGAGNATITAAGAITGTAGHGIYVVNSSPTNGTLSIAEASTGTITGTDSGIWAQAYGTSATTINIAGSVTGQGTVPSSITGGYPTSGLGVYVSNDTTSGSLSVQVGQSGSVTGANTGIYAENAGTGATLITTAGTVTGTSGDGIYAQNSSAATALPWSIDIATSGAVLGGTNGIVANNYGQGGLRITANADVTGTSGYGILAYNSSNDTTHSTLITQAAGTTTSGGIDGINANNNAGSLTINANGTSNGTAHDGIYAVNNAGLAPNPGTNLTISAANATGGTRGIEAWNYGNGFSSVTTTGTVTGTTNEGIYAVNAATATSLAVAQQSGAITGGTYGIYTLNNGTGATSVTQTAGLITGTSKTGIDVINGATATDLNINQTAGTVLGGQHAILANNSGTGATTVTTAGTLTGTTGDSFDIYNGPTATNLTVNQTAGSITGGMDGIDAVNAGTGATSVATAGSITAGATGNGIDATNLAPATNITIIQTAGSVTAGVTGINATNNGTGATTIQTAGSVTGTSGIGVGAYNGANTGALNVTQASGGTITGGTDGIYTNNVGANPTTITVNGAVAGSSGWGINTFSNAGNTTTINLNAGANVSATSGNAIQNNGGESTINVASGATLSGNVSLGNGSDIVNIAAGATVTALNTAGQKLDGGDDTSVADGWIDKLNLNGWSGTVNGANLLNWEYLNINGGDVVLSSTLTAGVVNVTNGGTLDGSNSPIVNAPVNVDGTSTLIAGNAAGNAAMFINGNLANAGTVRLTGPAGQKVAGDVLTVNGNYAGTNGKVVLDVVLGNSGSATDMLYVKGNVTGTSSLQINNVGGTGALTTGNGIQVVKVGGTSAAGAFALTSGPIDVGAFRYNLFAGTPSAAADPSWYLRSRARDIVVPSVAVARIGADVGMDFLGTLHERVGDQEHLGLQPAVATAAPGGMWARAIGKEYTETARSSAYGDMRSNGQYGGMEMGLDLVRKVASDGARTLVGVYGGYAWTGSNEAELVPSYLGVGKTSGDGWIAGLYATHYAASGWYADAVVQTNRLTENANANDGTTLKAKSKTWLASLEVGKPYALGSKLLQIEPQAQLIYGTTSLNPAYDSTGILNTWQMKDSLTGRVGFRLKRTVDFGQKSGEKLFTAYLKANVWRTLAGGTTDLTVGVSAPGEVTYRKTWGDVGFGTTFSLSKTAELYADSGYQFSIDQTGSNAMVGHIGARIRF